MACLEEAFHPRQHHALAVAAEIARAQSGREHLAIHARQLALEPARQDAACFGRLAIGRTQFPDRRPLARLLFFNGWTAALRDFAKDAAAFRSRHIRSPRRAMAA